LLGNHAPLGAPSALPFATICGKQCANLYEKKSTWQVVYQDKYNKEKINSTDNIFHESGKYNLFFTARIIIKQGKIKKMFVSFKFMIVV
jgi:hypothetical protein